MLNIWYLLIYSINISLVALIILLLKYLFKDLLSARWQYAVWWVLILRSLIPSTSSRNIFLPLGKYIEMLKFAVEDSLNSAYTDVYSLIRPGSPLPESLIPVSVTDYIFLIYIAGVLISALYFVASYSRLRFLVKKGALVPDEVRREISLTAGRYGLLVPKRIVYLKGLPSAFICGLMKPVLVLPEEKLTDEKIILHELLHFNRADTLKNAFWCAFRCVNWLNPLIHYVVSCVANDIESLCDLRTLEKLEGEERREYGKLLLSMVNERYQKVPCTSSLSNGGKNIARRIDSIVKFKKYPKGMGLVSVCIVIMLCVPCLYGSAAAIEQYYPENEAQLSLAIASARSARCTTMAGAIDTFSKGVVQENGIMLLCSSPESRHEELISSMLSSDKPGYYSSGIEFEHLTFEETGTSSAVYNIIKTGERTYKADIHFDIATDENTTELKEIYGEVPENNAVLVMPVIVENNNGWTVREAGDRFLLDINFDVGENYSFNFYEATGKTGKVKCSLNYKYFIKNERTDQNSFFGNFSYNTTPDLSAKFASEYHDDYTAYYANEETRLSLVGKYLSIATMKCDDEEEFENIDFEAIKERATSLGGLSGSGSSTDGTSWSGMSIYENWDGIEENMSGGGYSGDGITPEDNRRPFAYKIWIFADGELIDEFTIFTKED